MKRKIKFKGEPKFIWLGARGFPRNSEELEFRDGSIIRVSTAPSYRAALERIYTSSQRMDEADSEKYVFALIQYLDDEDEDTFYLLLKDFKEWHKVIDMDYKNETE